VISGSRTPRGCRRSRAASRAARAASSAINGPLSPIGIDRDPATSAAKPILAVFKILPTGMISLLIVK
jgi:hypothetical protein